MKIMIAQIDLTLTEPMLGTVPKDKEIYTRFIKSKAPENTDTSDELESIEEAEKAGWSGYHTLPDGTPFLMDYHIKGFLKETCGILRRVNGTYSNGDGMKSYKKVIDGLVFAFPRQIPIVVTGEMGILERPLRAPTPKGDRVALVKSDTVPAGSKLSFELHVLGVVKEPWLREWFDYGQLKGFGQWRNASYGRFNYEMRIRKEVKNTKREKNAGDKEPGMIGEVDGDGVA